MDKKILIITFFLFIVVAMIFPVEDLDLGWHLQTGKYIVQNHSFPQAGEFSYSAEGRWVMDEWLAQVVLFIIYNFFGVGGLIVLRVLFVFLIFLLLFKMCRRSGISPELAVVLLLSVFFLGRSRLLIRPSLFNLLFFTVFLYMFFSYSCGIAKKGVFLLPLLQVLWVNCHPGHVLGVFLAGVFFAGKVFDRKVFKSLVSDEEYKHDLAVSFGVFAAVIAGVLVNPYFIGAFVWPFKHYFAAGREAVIRNVAELQPLALFSRGVSLYVMIFVLLFVFATGTFIARKKKQSVANIIMFIVFFMMTLTSRRHIALFAIVAYFVSVSNRAYIKAYISDKERFPVKKAVTVSLSVLLIICTLMTVLCVNPLYADSLRCFATGYSPSLAEQAVMFCAKDDVPDRVFNEHSMGGMCINSFYPNKKVFIDGRNLLYIGDVFNSYISVLNKPSMIEDMADTNGINTVFFRHASSVMDPLTYYLFDSPLWKCIYLDEWACVFTREESCELDGIDREGVRKISGEYLNRCGELEDAAGFIKRNRLKRQAYFGCINWAHLFDVLDEPRAQERFYETAAELNSFGRIALEQLAYHNLSVAQYDKSLESYKRFRRRAPFDVRSLNNIASIHILKGNDNKAMLALDTAAVLSPFNPEISFNRAILFLRKGYIDKALSLCRYALFLKRDYYQAFAMLGDIYRAKGDLQRALFCYAQAIKIKPDFASCFNRVGRLYMYELKEYDTARAFFRQAIALDNNGKATQDAENELQVLKEMMASR